MLSIDDVQTQWEVDCQIDQGNLGECSSRIPLLHSKYIQLLSKARLQQRKALSSYMRLRRARIRWYNGELTQQELQQYGWNQYQGLKPIKSEIEKILATDELIIREEEKSAYMDTLVVVVESIMQSIKSRTWDVKNAIEWAKMQTGD